MRLYFVEVEGIRVKIHKSNRGRVELGNFYPKKK